MRMPIINRQYLLKTGVLQPGDQRLQLRRLSLKGVEGACHIQSYDLDEYTDQAAASIAEFFTDQLN